MPATEAIRRDDENVGLAAGCLIVTHEIGRVSCNCKTNTTMQTLTTVIICDTISALLL